MHLVFQKTMLRIIKDLQSFSVWSQNLDSILCPVLTVFAT